MKYRIGLVRKYAYGTSYSYVYVPSLWAVAKHVVSIWISGGSVIEVHRLVK